MMRCRTLSSGPEASFSHASPRFWANDDEIQPSWKRYFFFQYCGLFVFFCFLGSGISLLCDEKKAFFGIINGRYHWEHSFFFYSFSASDVSRSLKEAKRLFFFFCLSYPSYPCSFILARYQECFFLLSNSVLFSSFLACVATSCTPPSLQSGKYPSENGRRDVPIVLADTFYVSPLYICNFLSSEEQRSINRFITIQFTISLDKTRFVVVCMGGTSFHVSMPTPARVYYSRRLC